MEDFRRRLQELKEAAQAQKTAAQWQAQAAQLLAAYRQRSRAQRLEDITLQRLDILAAVLESLGCREALLALRDSGLARDYQGPEVTRDARQGYVKLVLARRWRRWPPFRRFEHQIGVRAYDAGSVVIEVAEFRRSGQVWKVTPLSPPLTYTIEDREAIETAIADALLAWAEGRLR